MRKRFGFTMLELIFVIVVIGILSKFGVEFLAQAYRSFIASNINNTLQTQSASAVEFIAKRLQYRIKDSVIARENTGTFVPIADANTSNFIVLEWIGEDIDGFRGDISPYWSGILDLDNPLTFANNGNLLVSPATRTGDADTLISLLSGGTATATTFNDSALYFVGTGMNILGFGWNGTYNGNLSNTMWTAWTADTNIFPIKSHVTSATYLVPNGGSFTARDIYEYYKLAWTAYAIEMQNYDPATNMGDLVLHYDYQPWAGESYNINAKTQLIMENVSTFQFRAIDSLIKIQVCVKSDLIQNEEYSLCKDKTIY